MDGLVYDYDIKCVFTVRPWIFTKIYCFVERGMEGNYMKTKNMKTITDKTPSVNKIYVSNGKLILLPVNAIGHLFLMY